MLYKAVVEHVGSGFVDRRAIEIVAESLEEARAKAFGKGPGNSVLEIIEVGPSEQALVRIDAGRSGKCEKKPVRLWTIRDPKPGLPIYPIHNDNAFLEDQMHDWSWREGTIQYFSRVGEVPVWVLVEF